MVGLRHSETYSVELDVDFVCVLLKILFDPIPYSGDDYLQNDSL